MERVILGYTYLRLMQSQVSQLVEEFNKNVRPRVSAESAREGMRTHIEELEEAVLSYQNRLRKVIEKKRRE
jgi:FtsZ-binding cell division protein ZapB